MLWRTGYVGYGLREDDSGLGHSNSFYGEGCTDGYVQSLRIGISNVFGGTDHDPAGDEFDIFTGVEHFGKIVYSGIGIRTSHAF